MLSRLCLALLALSLSAATGSAAAEGDGIGEMVIHPDRSADLSLLKRQGGVSLTEGDVSAARARLIGPAQAGDPAAARMLAETYDPRWLRDSGVIGATGLVDIEQAASWYDQAIKGGDQVAIKRFADQEKEK